LYGNLLHAILERALSDGRWDDAELDAKANEVVRERMDELLRVDVDVPQARRELKIRARGLRGFADRYLAESALVPISSQGSAIPRAKTFGALDVDVDSHGEQHGTPKPDAILLSTRAGKDEQNLLSITRTLDVEEDIWSPSLGLRGKLDAAVMATVQPAPPAQSFASFSHFRERVKEAKKQRRTGPVPFEIKTGRPNGGGGMEHRAQTMLYTMLLEERMGRRVERGLLYYTQSEEVVDVPVALQAGAGRGASAIEKMKAGGGCGNKSMGKGAKAVKMGTARNEVRALVGVRNELAAWVGKRGRMWDREWRESRKRNGEEVVGEVDESKEAWRGPPHEDKKSKVDVMSIKSDVKLGNVKQEKAVKVEQGEDVLIEEVKTEGVKMEEEVQATKNMHSVAASVQDDVTTGAATLAFDLHELEEFLPPPIDDERVCTRCYALDTCMLFRKVGHSLTLMQG
jgi:CRISPR/Cas system-associated exonuclease Cas4 (RecB family)